MITEKELAEIVFKGIGRKKSDYEILLNGETLNPYPVKDFIFSWPDPCAFGLVVDAAEKHGYDWEYFGGWFAFVKPREDGHHRIAKFQWVAKNPMWAVCRAFREVLKLEGKL